MAPRTAQMRKIKQVQKQRLDERRLTDRSLLAPFDGFRWPVIDRLRQKLEEGTRMGFNPNEHMSKLKGKDYLEVKWRLVWFRDEHPDWGILTDIKVFDERIAVVIAKITDENGAVKAMGTKSETPKDFGDYLEKAETGAIGRALAHLGYGTQFAPELEEGDRIVDGPVDRKPVGQPQRPTMSRPEPAPQKEPNSGAGEAQADPFGITVPSTDDLMALARKKNVFLVKWAKEELGRNSLRDMTDDDRIACKARLDLLPDKAS